MIHQSHSTLKFDCVPLKGSTLPSPTETSETGWDDPVGGGGVGQFFQSQSFSSPVGCQRLFFFWGGGAGVNWGGGWAIAGARIAVT